MKVNDWSGLITAMLDHLIITQIELAERCHVAQQTVSAWKTGRRRPGRFAQRQLMALAHEHGLMSLIAPPADSNVHESAPAYDLSSKVLKMARLVETMPHDVQEEILHFVEFKKQQL